MKYECGRQLYEFTKDTAAERVGQRIRAVRHAKGLTQAELGKMVGLSGDRIQKYENGVRKPKTDLLEKIAASMDVDIQAFTDPVTATRVGAIHALFEMEQLYDLDVKREGGRLVLMFGNGRSDSLNGYIDVWEERKRRLENDITNSSSEEEKAEILKEYNEWKWNFPRPIDLKLK